MTTMDEHRFEIEICQWLVDHGGYDGCRVGAGPEADDPPQFNQELGLDMTEMLAFISATQFEQWEELVKRYGGNPDTAQISFAKRVAKLIDERGTVEVLRNEVVDQGVRFRLAYFKPAHGLTQTLLDRYAANRLTIIRQLPYEPESTRTVDVGLFVNGIPVATAELKNRMTGQTINDAKQQYRTDRDPKNTTLSRRAVVHFAVDSEEVAMTTRLAGEATGFLPFNLGHDRGAGNPPDPDGGHRTAYLWERVWQRDAWLDLLQRFVHVARPDKTATATSRRRGRAKAPPEIIFPRYHQWDAVLALEAAARREGPGHDYLVEHSAGSGKSNTIAWLAHRLSTLHDDTDTKVFDKVVVITDRRVLDKQLQDTIKQFERVEGVVQKIDVDSRQLAEALAGQQARIVVTTLQKFPVVVQMGLDLPDRRYAVIVDEAHSSQTGEAANKLKQLLGVGVPEQTTDDGDEGDGEPESPAEEALAAVAAARMKQPNLSFFAFTATPKGRTLEKFGRKSPATGKHEPFHLYSMRQAIEEKFILDVLDNYVTYKTYWQIEKAIADDPAYDAARARAAIARFLDLHAVNLAQKAELVAEHFRTHVRRRIGGRAKAMVVTNSRKQAVRHKLALDKYCRDHGYGDVGVLVAFSGTVPDNGESYTEANMNGFPESQTAERFASDDYQIMVVAEKYQTGFDQPLLYAMYVDKVLSDLAAVQTLSRLNRTHDGKDGTFVLDFRNKAEDIRTAFEPWYGQTVAPPTDPNRLYDTHHEVEQFGVLWPEEVEAAVALLVTAKDDEDMSRHGRFHGLLTPAVDRFRNDLDDDEQDQFRDALTRFVRTYSFLSQVVSFTDTGLERDYLYCKALAPFIRREVSGTLDLGSEVELTHLRIEQTFSGSLSLEPTDGEVSTVFSGTGTSQDTAEEPLSRIIAKLNERFSTNWAPEDRVFYDVVGDKLAQREDIQQAAATSTPENFKLGLRQDFVDGVIDQLNVSTEMVDRFLSNEDLQDVVLAAYAPLIQAKAMVARQQLCPIGELLGPDRESQHLEYKATLRTTAAGGEVFKPLETASLKTIAAFLNSYEGGTLLIGVADDGSIHGLDSDYASLHNDGKDDRDVFQLHLGNIVTTSMGAAAAVNVNTQIHTVDGHDICRAHVRPSGFPVDATVTVVQNDQHLKKTVFYVRVANGTKELDDNQKQKYVTSRWPGTPPSDSQGPLP